MHTRITPIDICAEDHQLATRFASIAPTVEYGLRKFPSPRQYHDLVADVFGKDPQIDMGRLYVLAQRDWHVRGQTGCQFARLAALQADALRWQYLVVDPGVPYYRAQVEQYLRSLPAERDVEVVSLLFPDVQSGAQAVEVVRDLVRSTSFWLERDFERHGLLHLHLRYPVGEVGYTVKAWVMGFAPFDFMPNTRRGPYMELAIRVKAKPEWIFHRLNQDRDVAHLADLPLVMPDDRWEHRWQSTRTRTRMILGGEPDDISAAKSTFTVPIVRRSDLVS